MWSRLQENTAAHHSDSQEMEHADEEIGLVLDDADDRSEGILVTTSIAVLRQKKNLLLQFPRYFCLILLKPSKSQFLLQPNANFFFVVLPLDSC